MNGGWSLSLWSVRSTRSLACCPVRVWPAAFSIHARPVCGALGFENLSLLSFVLHLPCNLGLAPPSLGPRSFVAKWNSGHLALSQASCFPQSLDAQPEQLALRPKEFFRAYGIEVLTEAQVQAEEL